MVNSKTKTKLVLPNMGMKIKNYSRYILPLRSLQDIYHTSLLLKNLIDYWWMTWADWYQVNIIIIKATYISVNIIFMAAPVKGWWKTISKDASYILREDQIPRSSQQEGVWQSQVYKKRIPTTFTFCHLRGFRKRST